LFGVELRAFLPHCPLLSPFSWGAAPAPRGKKGMGPSCLLTLHSLLVTQVESTLRDLNLLPGIFIGSYKIEATGYDILGTIKASDY
jgi:hypothetical protein